MLLRKMPHIALPEDKSTMVMYAGASVFTVKQWNEMYAACEMEFPSEVVKENAFKSYFNWGRQSYLPFFNNGAVLVRYDKSRDIQLKLAEVRDGLISAHLVGRIERLDHFFDQVCLSIAVIQLNEWCLFPPGVNALASRVDLRNPLSRRKISLYHYLTGSNEAHLKRYMIDGFARLLSEKRKSSSNSASYE
jgi:hypothetical protein